MSTLKRIAYPTMTPTLTHTHQCSWKRPRAWSTEAPMVWLLPGASFCHRGALNSLMAMPCCT